MPRTLTVSRVRVRAGAEAEYLAAVRELARAGRGARVASLGVPPTRTMRTPTWSSARAGAARPIARWPSGRRTSGRWKRGSAPWRSTSPARGSCGRRSGKCPDGSSRWTASAWEVAVSGRSTQYTKDEFGLVFTRGTGPDREQRVVRYSPLGAKSRELSLGEPERPRSWRDLLAVSQPALDRARAGLPPLTATGQAPPAGPTVDLHVHSTASDGSLAPEAVVQRARAAGLDGDRAHRPRYRRRRARGGRGRRAARRPGGRRLRVLHRRALGRDARPGVLPSDRLARCSRPSSSAAAPIACGAPAPWWTGCSAMGVTLDFDDVLRQARGGAVGRPHVARAIVLSGAAAGHVGRRSTATSAGAGRRSSRRCSRRSREVAELVHAVRGIVSVAHLKDRGTRSFLERLKGAGARRGRDPSPQPRP